MNRRYGSSLISLLLLTGLLASCTTSPYHYGRNARGSKSDNKEALRPTVAVTDFENRANFDGQWNLGSGFADVLVRHLIDSQRVVVLERKYIHNILTELDLQEDGRFRPEGRVAQAKLKNVHYLVRGAITDFSVTGNASGWFGNSKGRLGIGGSRGRVALHITISSVETGEILTSVKSTGTASAGFLSGSYNYSGLAFGGDAYFRTPLGKATDEAMQKAVRRILQALPAQRWNARVAEAYTDGSIIINGGKNVGLTPGTLFEVRAPPRQVTDPATGNVIETVPGGIIGQVQVREVKGYSAHGVLLNGKALRGDLLIKIQNGR